MSEAEFVLDICVEGGDLKGCNDGFSVSEFALFICVEGGDSELYIEVKLDCWFCDVKTGIQWYLFLNIYLRL